MEEKHINLQSKKKFCSTHDSVVTFLDVVGKLTVTVTVRLFRDNANNQKYVIVEVLKMTFLYFPR